MHTFQPMTADMMEFDPFTKIGKEWALLTAGSKEKANTMTISWGGAGRCGLRLYRGLLPARRCGHLRRDDGAVPGLLPGKHDLSQAPPPAAGG